MKQRFSVLPAVAVYYGLTSIFLFWKIDSFFKDVLVAPLYFVMPTGIGLLLFALAGVHKRLAGRIGAATLTMMGTFVGIVAVTLLYQDLERMQRLSTWFPYIYPPLLGLSLAGFFRARALLEVERETLKFTARTLVWLAPVALLSYYFLFLKFSSFPLRDIFQETHFMKGAHELSRFQVLNPYVTASYLSIIQVHQGLLNHFYNYDLLNSQWILPAYAYMFHLGCYAVFFSAIVRETVGVRLALALATVIAPMFFIENMIMLESMLLVFFVVLIRLDGDAMTPRRALSTAFWLLLLFAVYFVYFNYVFVDHHVFSGVPSPYSGMWIVGLLLLFMTYRLTGATAGNPVFVAFLAISMFAMHRGILLFFPMLLFVYLVYAVVFHGQLFNAPRLKYSLVRGVFVGFSLFAVSLLLFDYYLVMSQTGEARWTSDMAYRIGETLLRTTVIVGGGTGFNHSLVEYLRLSPPLILLFVFTSMLVYVAHRQGARSVTGSEVPGTEPKREASTDRLNQVLFLVLVIPPLVLVVHSTVPYVYRGAFFPSVLTIALLAVLYGFYRKSFLAGTSVQLALAWTFLAVAGVLFDHFFLYDYKIDTVGNANPYLKALFPLSQFVFLFLVFLPMMLFWRRWRLAVIVALVPVTTVAAVAMDTLSFRTMFYDKAYGAQLPDTGVISHYSQDELQLAKTLRTQPAKTLLISDPYTLSILRAVTGLNSVYSFANINLVTEPKLYRDTFRLLSGLGGIDQDRERKQLLSYSDRIRGLVAAEGYYLWNRDHPGTGGELMTLDGMYDYFVWVISARTLQWAEGNEDYYPDNSRLDERLIGTLQRYFDILTNVDNRLLVLKLKRPTRQEAAGQVPFQRNAACPCPR